MASTLSRTDLWLRHIPAVRGTCASCRSRRWSPRLSTGILASRPLGRITGVAGSSHVLEKLKDHGYALGIVTNCSTNLGRQAVQKCDRPYSSSSSSSPPSSSSIFDGVITAEEVGFYKPHPNTYLAILSALGVQPDEAIFVAGSSGDVLGAAAVGMQVVWHNRIGLPALPGSAPLVEAQWLDVALERFLE